MQQLELVVRFIRDYYEMYVWLAAGILVVLLQLMRSGLLLRKGSAVQKGIAYTTIGLYCYVVSIWIKDFSLSDYFAGFPYAYYGHLLVKLLLLELIVFLGAKAILYLVLNPPKLDFLRQHKWFFLILGWLIWQTVLTPVFKLDTWSNTWYATDYSLGIGTRFLSGAFCHLLFGDFVSEAQIITVIYCSLLLLFVCVAAFGEAVIQKANEEIRPAVSFLVLCYLCSPASAAAMGQLSVFGRTENHTLVVCAIVVLLFVKIKSARVKYVMLAILGTLCNAIYQGYVFLYFPILLMLMVEDIFSQKGHQLHRLGMAASACIPVGVSFLYFQFFAGTTLTNASEMAALLRQRTDMEIIEGPLYYELFVPITTAYHNITEPFLLGGEAPRQKLVLTMLLVLPVIVIALAIYLECFALVRAKGQKVLCTPYPWFLLMQLFALPQFILNVDWGRWMIALGVDLFFGILYLVYRQHTEMLQAMQSLTRILKQQRILALLTLLWLASIGKFKARAFVPEVNTLWELLICSLH